MDSTAEKQSPDARVLMEDTGEVLDLTNEELQLYRKFHNVIGAARRLSLAVVDKLAHSEPWSKYQGSPYVYENIDGTLAAPDGSTLEVHMLQATENGLRSTRINEVILSNSAQPSRKIRISPESRSVELREGDRTGAVAFIEERDYMDNVGKVQTVNDKGPTGGNPLLDQARDALRILNGHLPELRLVEPTPSAPIPSPATPTA